MRGKMVWGILAGVMVSVSAFAEIQTETVLYKDGDVTLEGYYAADDAVTGVPGIVLVHEWKGLGDYAKRRARELAGLGYAVLAADMYGQGVRPQTHEEAAKVSGMYRSDRQLMRRRILAAVEELKRHSDVDARNLAAVGYCFGGTSVIELARSGADVKGVVSFHGGLDSPNPADGKNIRAKVLVLHGADDPFVSKENIEAFEKEMKEAGVDYRSVAYPGVVHSFTVPEAGNDPSKGMAYNAEADQKSWNEMKKFLSELFTPGGAESAADRAND